MKELWSDADIQAAVAGRKIISYEWREFKNTRHNTLWQAPGFVLDDGTFLAIVGDEGFILLEEPK